MGVKTNILATVFTLSSLTAAAQNNDTQRDDVTNGNTIELNETPRSAATQDASTLDLSSSLLAQQSGRQVSAIKIAGLSDGSGLYRGMADPGHKAYGTDQPYMYFYQNPNGDLHDITDALPTTIQGGPNIKQFKYKDQMATRMQKAGFGSQDMQRIATMLESHGKANERRSQYEQDAAYHGYGKVYITISGSKIRISAGGVGSIDIRKPQSRPQQSRPIRTPRGRGR